MPVDTQKVMEVAEELGKLLGQHPAVEKYKQAQKAVADDAEAARLLGEFDRQIEALGRLEQSGGMVTDAQRMQLEALQSRIVSHIKIKALNMAQVDVTELLTKVRAAYQKPMTETSPVAVAAASGPKLTMPR
jgi:cell fate (sporulation/competence/biofilm development) regulator YlbF (YheA/YmcA/DUF963 family)